jgi:hypothetical protein
LHPYSLRQIIPQKLRQIIPQTTTIFMPTAPPWPSEASHRPAKASGLGIGEVCCAIPTPLKSTITKPKIFQARMAKFPLKPLTVYQSG